MTNRCPPSGCAPLSCIVVKYVESMKVLKHCLAFSLLHRSILYDCIHFCIQYHRVSLYLFLKIVNILHQYCLLHLQSASTLNVDSEASWQLGIMQQTVRNSCTIFLFYMNCRYTIDTTKCPIIGGTCLIRADYNNHLRYCH